MAEEEAAPDTNSEGDGLSECVICFTPYDTLFHLPKILSCGHVFCLECLSRITVGSTEPQTLPCPICRSATPVSSKKGPPALSTDRNLLTRLNKSFSCPTPSLRFNRKRGVLYVPQTNSLNISSVSLSVDLGRPPPDPHSPRRLCLLFRSGGCVFYGSIVLIIILTIALILAGVYIFYLLPWRFNSTAGPGMGGNTTVTPNNTTSGTGDR
ncbi:RING finger protein 225 [Rana temporaria]|uniref:RING finger protein 225 n=1 Tax=Rana temporaria TaxID=8407 RepID=UPI001AACE8B1|nr:RING finger protein 225 [Rana temporaria]XP_040180931.1 RING finger protein 225 [Rana temporaria]XP_040180932.1 RING finger protein 225 [Rana temporaria]